ncbi:acyl-CoA dehydrogenase family protein [Streptomyces bambusae]|uniref:acyl-CoA dehydrogenase family protein n=1 Tax=Streptomyces bambusae TaxID=1550616 RepID=UPI001CFF242A|nr:acyl-CoA dehydrogenase family protein [Streptomyces bambusae]MCB5165700.1 acyl-CoA dehydrogenase family protein [Streptomyces bambusae]
MPGTVNGSLTSTLTPALRARLAEAAAESARTGRPDREVLGLLRQSGLLATAVPREHGGAGGDGAQVNRVVERIAADNPSVAIIAFQHFAVSARIAEWGTDEQKQRLLPALADGTVLAASAWSETGAGAAKRNLASTGIRRDDGSWVLHGTKAFTTGAGVADLYLVLVSTGAPAADAAPGEPEAPAAVYGAAGQTFFLVDAANPGIAPQPGPGLLGMRGSATGIVRLTECAVGDDSRLGPQGAATEIIAGVRRSGATLGAVSVGIAEAALDHGLRHAARLGLLSEPAVSHRLADLAARLESARALVERAGARTAPDPGLTTLYSKLHASTTAEDICLDVARLTGSTGYLGDDTAARLFADARGIALMGPANPLCRELAVTSWN